LYKFPFLFAFKVARASMVPSSPMKTLNWSTLVWVALYCVRVLFY
jgi:hypothetical protein